MACFGCFGSGQVEETEKEKEPKLGKSDRELKASKSARKERTDCDEAGSHKSGAKAESREHSDNGMGDAGSRPEVSPTSSKRGTSFKRNASKKGSHDNLHESGRGEGPHRGESPTGVPRVDSKDKRQAAAQQQQVEDLSRSRSLRKNMSDREGASPGPPVSGAAELPAVVNRGMKLTQSLKAPPTKAPQPAFSLSKKKPKDAATEARLQEEASKLDELLKSSDLRAFQYTELKAATKGFSMDMLIGAGGFGKVYRGVVKLGQTQLQRDAGENAPASAEAVEVAIKRLEAKSLQGHKEWMVEICMLGLVNHPHLVRLLGFCAEGEKRLLVYEFLPYFSLDRYLFALDPQQPILDWNTRLRIALGSARGLAHLHEEISPPIIYRDFKTSNILLDEDFNPKLSDFGLAREGPSMDRTHVSTQVRGTAGYAAPEYMLTGHLTPKADVWSFGVVLLEMLTGRPSIDQRRPQHEMKLVPLARQRLQAPGDILEMMDPNLEGQFPPQAAAKVAEVAKWCLQSDPGNRPLMSELVEVLAYLSRPEQWE